MSFSFHMLGTVPDFPSKIICPHIVNSEASPPSVFAFARGGAVTALVFGVVFRSFGSCSGAEVFSSAVGGSGAGLSGAASKCWFPGLLAGLLVVASFAVSAVGAARWSPGSSLQSDRVADHHHPVLWFGDPRLWCR